MDLSTRVEEPQWSATLPLSPLELERVSRFFERSNRLLGGHACVVRHFEGWSRRWPHGETIRVLDVGTGAGDLLLALRRWADHRGLRLALTGIDAAKAVLDRARRRLRGRDVELRDEDLFQFAAGARRFDYVTASLFLSHVPAVRQKDALLALDKLAVRGLIVSDVQRTRPAYWGIRALTTAFGDRVMRHDGPAFVRRGFTVRELASLAGQSGLGYLAAQPEPFCRVTLAGAKL